MKKLFLLTKTLLAVALLCVGQNAWGEDTEVTLSCTSSITVVGTSSYGDDGSGYSNLIRLNSYAGQGGAGAVAFTLDSKWDASKVKSAILKIYPTSKPNKNRSGNIYIKSIDGYPDLSGNTSASFSDGKHIVYKETSSSSRRYSFSGTIQATIAASAYTSGVPAQGAYYDVDLTTYFQSLTTKSVGDLVYLGIDISDWALETQLGAYGNTNAPKLVITYTSETLYTASFTANSGTLSPTVTIYSDAGRTSPVTNGTLLNETTYYYRAVLEGYHNVEGSFTVSGANPSISFTMEAKTVYSYSVNAVDGEEKAVKEEIISGTCYKDETTSYYLPSCVLVDGTLHFMEAEASYKSETVSENNQVFSYPYTTSSVDNVVFFVEGESISGALTSTPTNNQRLASKGYMGRGSNLSVTTLPAGVYTIYVKYINTNSGGHNLLVKAGDTDVINATDVTVRPTKSGSVTLTEPTAITLTAAASSTSGVDYLYIVKTGEVATIGSRGYATFSSKNPVNVDVTGLEAYIATEKSGDYVTMEKVEGDVAANTGLVLKGAAGNYTLPFAASGTSYTGTNHLWAITEGETVNAASTGYTNYVLTVQSEEVVWAPIEDTPASVTAGHAALCLATGGGARAIRMSFGNITGVDNVEAATEAKAQEGKFIENGKLVIVKNGVKYNAAGQQVK